MLVAARSLTALRQTVTWCGGMLGVGYRRRLVAEILRGYDELSPATRIPLGRDDELSYEMVRSASVIVAKESAAEEMSLLMDPKLIPYCNARFLLRTYESVENPDSVVVSARRFAGGMDVRRK